MENCIFCKIVRKDIPSTPLYEDDKVIVLLDIHPSAPGHTMVIPKKHGASILDFSAEELGTLMDIVKKMAETLEQALGCEAITIGINHKEERGLPHLHIHLIPRWKNDGGQALQGVVSNTPEEPLDAIRKKILTVLN